MTCIECRGHVDHASDIPFPMVVSDHFHIDPKENTMAKIVIKDLTESVDLDRQAMVAIMGGARTPGRHAFPGQTISGSTRIVNYPSGVTRNRLAGRSIPAK